MPIKTPEAVALRASFEELLKVKDELSGTDPLAAVSIVDREVSISASINPSLC